MKKVFLLFAGAGLFMTSCVSNPEGEKAETTDAQEVKEAVEESVTYTLNTEESTLRWEARKVSATHHGTVEFKSGEFYVEGSEITGGRFVTDMSTIVNEDLEGEWNEKLVGHLMSDDFFSVENHPETVFEITGVESTDQANIYKVSGNLIIKGISKNITFNAEVGEVSDTKLTMNADFNIERENWDITYAGAPDDLIAKEINFKVNLVAYL